MRGKQPAGACLGVPPSRVNAADGGIGRPVAMESGIAARLLDTPGAEFGPAVER